MNKYENGKIYRLVCNITGLNYYGSTCQPLHKRKMDHKYKYNDYLKKTCETNYSSFKIIEGGNYDIILVEEFKCENKNQLEARERYFIENNECINKNIPTRTLKEYLEVNKDTILKKKKEHYEANKEELLKKNKEYREANKEAISKHRKEYQKEYRQKNKDIVNQKKREYHEKNKDIVNQKQREYREKKKNQPIN